MAGQNGQNSSEKSVQNGQNGQNGQKLTLKKEEILACNALCYG